MPAVFPTLVPVPGRTFTFTDALFPGVRIFFGYNAAPGNLAVGDPLSARAEFLAALTNTAQNYGFEGTPNWTSLSPPYSATFTGSVNPIVATVALEAGAGAGLISVVGSLSAGRFNTTTGGSRYLNAAALTTGGGVSMRWSVTPDRAVAAFGFYVTDVGDFAAFSLLDLRRPGGAVLEMMLPIAQNVPSGTLAFYGVIDTAGGTFDKFIFGSTYVGSQGTADYFGFDDFVLADAGQVIAEPPAPAPPSSFPGTSRPFISRDVKNAPGIQLQPFGREAPPPPLPPRPPRPQR